MCCCNSLELFDFGRLLLSGSGSDCTFIIHSYCSCSFFFFYAKILLTSSTSRKLHNFLCTELTSHTRWMDESHIHTHLTEIKWNCALCNSALISLCSAFPFNLYFFSFNLRLGLRHLHAFVCLLWEICFMSDEKDRIYSRDFPDGQRGWIRDQRMLIITPHKRSSVRMNQWITYMVIS